MTGPDGTLWVADMYRQVIEHPEWIPEAWQERLNLYAGNDRGRIYRVYRTDQSDADASRFEIPNLAEMSDAEVVNQLSSGNGWRRDTAQLLLIQREQLSAGAHRRLLALLKDPQSLTRLHALGVVNGRGDLSVDALVSALQDDDPRIVRQAVEFSETRLDDSRVLAAVVSLSAHEDAGVRLQTALSLGESSSQQAAEALALLATSENADEWQRAAVLCSAYGKAEWMLATVLRDAPQSEARTELVSQLIATALGDDPAAGAAQILSSIAPGNEDVEGWQIVALGTVLDSLQRDRIDLDRLERDSTELREAFAGVQPLFKHARSLAADHDADISLRIATAAVLARRADHAETDRDLLTTWLTPQSAPELQAAAVEALARTAAEDVPLRLLANWSKAAPALRSAILQALVSRDVWTRDLLSALQDHSLSISDLDAATRNRLAEHPDPDIRNIAESLLGASASADRQKVVDAHREVLDLRADTARGALVFQQRCAACHKLGTTGQEVGAPLSALQNKSTDFLLAAILDPNRATEAKFTAYSMLLTDGRVLSGLILEETATSITLAKADGTRDVLLRVDIEELSGTGKSFMPEGLERDLTPQQIADVIAYVQSVVTEPPGAP
jgi:putative heme-binding domain-containing protein